MSKARYGTEEVGHTKAEEECGRCEVGFPGQCPHQEGEDGPTEEVCADGGHVVLGVVGIGSGDAEGGNEKCCVRDPVQAIGAESRAPKGVTVAIFKETCNHLEG